MDQSGKVEDTSRKTVIGLSDGVKFTVLINAREKRKLQERFRLMGEPKIYVDVLFSYLVYTAIKGAKCFGRKINIDIEYTGHTKIIEEKISWYFGKRLCLEWILVGKNSKAHDLAYKAMKGKIKAGRIVSADEVWKVVNKKTGGYLNSGLKPENRYSAPVLGKILTKRPKKSR